MASRTGKVSRGLRETGPRTGAAVDAGNFCGSRLVAKDRMFKICIFVNDSDVNDLSFVKAIHNFYF